MLSLYSIAKMCGDVNLFLRTVRQGGILPDKNFDRCFCRANRVYWCCQAHPARPGQREVLFYAYNTWYRYDRCAGGGVCAGRCLDRQKRRLEGRGLRRQLRLVPQPVRGPRARQRQKIMMQHAPDILSGFFCPVCARQGQGLQGMCPGRRPPARQRRRRCSADR